MPISLGGQVELASVAMKMRANLTTLTINGATKFSCLLSGLNDVTSKTLQTVNAPGANGENLRSFQELTPILWTLEAGARTLSSDQKSVEALYQGLMQTPNITSLNLSIGSLGSRIMLAELLATMTSTLRHLSLRYLVTWAGLIESELSLLSQKLQFGRPYWLRHRPPCTPRVSSAGGSRPFKLEPVKVRCHPCPSCSPLPTQPSRNPPLPTAPAPALHSSQELGQTR